MEEYASYKKHCLIDSFGNSITDEGATILAAMNTQSDRHSVLHISKTNYYDKKMLLSIIVMEDMHKHKYK
jgi:hypothetical protein